MIEMKEWMVAVIQRRKESQNLKAVELLHAKEEKKKPKKGEKPNVRYLMFSVLRLKFDDLVAEKKRSNEDHDRSNEEKSSRRNWLLSKHCSFSVENTNNRVTSIIFVP